MLTWNTCLIVLLARTLLAAGPHAPAPAIRAAIPFAFEADGVQLPSGQYVVAAALPGEVTLRADAPNGPKVTVEATVDRYSNGCNCLRFHRYADGRYVLSDVQSLEVVSAMRKSRREYPLEAVEVPLR